MKKYWKNAKKTGKVREIRQSKKVGTMSTNKTQRKLQTDHGPRKTGTGTTVQQEHQSTTKT